VRDVDAVEQHRELRRVELGAERAVVKGRQPEAPLLEALVGQHEAAAVPGEDLHPVAAARHEDEEVAGVEILFPAALHDGGEPVDALAEIHWVRGEQHADRARQQEHPLPEGRE
jgi:hypothetical protein